MKPTALLIPLLNREGMIGILSRMFCAASQMSHEPCVKITKTERLLLENFPTSNLRWTRFQSILPVARRDNLATLLLVTVRFKQVLI